MSNINSLKKINNLKNYNTYDYVLKEDAWKINKFLKEYIINNQEKGKLTLCEFIIYNFFRNKPLFNGSEYLRPENYNYFSRYSLYYNISWEYLIKNNNSEFYKYIKKELGDEIYEKILMFIAYSLRENFKNKKNG